jgi:hypothetical protein
MRQQTMKLLIAAILIMSTLMSSAVFANPPAGVGHRDAGFGSIAGGMFPGL